MAILNLLLASSLLFAGEFKTGHVMVGSHKIKVEIAENSHQHQLGLMNRSSLAKDEGMLFIFSDERPRSFWMKNTYIALSIAFADGKGKILNLMDMKPSLSITQKQFPTYESAGPAKYALEMSQGWFHKKGIKPGDFIRLLK